MESNVSNLVDQIYMEGLEKARLNAEKIIASANSEAETIRAQAESQARQILEQANQKAELLKENTLAELQQSSSQCLSELRTNTQNLLANHLLADYPAAALLDAEFVKDLVLKLAASWDHDGANSGDSLQILLPETSNQEFQERLASSLRAALPGLGIQTSNDLSNGFQIKGELFRLDFSDETLRTLLGNFIKLSTRKMLFGKETS